MLHIKIILFIILISIRAELFFRKQNLPLTNQVSLSDACIQRAELSNTQSMIINLQYNMELEFTEQVEKIRRGKNPTKLAVEVANYAPHHLSEPISTDALWLRNYVPPGRIFPQNSKRKPV